MFFRAPPRQLDEIKNLGVSPQVGALDVHLKAEDPTSPLPIVTGMQSTLPTRLVMFPSRLKEIFRPPQKRRCRFLESRGLSVELCPYSTSMNSKIPAFKT